MFTQTQQFFQHDGNFSLRSTASTKSSEEDHSLGIRSEIDHLVSPDNSSTKSPEDDETDATGSETDTVSLVTEHAFRHPRGSDRGVDGKLSQVFFSTVQEDTQPSGDDEEEDEEEEGGDSTTSSAPSLSTTPVIPDRYPGDRNTSPLLLSRDRMRETLPNDSSTTELGSSVVSGHLEETLKSAVHVTQLLLGHTAPEQIQIEPVPTIIGTNEAEIESARALQGLTAASFAGQATLRGPHDVLEETVNNGREEKEEDSAPPQGPPTFPDALQLPSRTSGDEQGMSTSPEWPRPRSMAQSAFTLDNVGYVKTGMATPHRVGGGSAEGRERYTTSSRGSPGNRNGGSLVDFIDRPSDTRNSTQNRLKPRVPDIFGPRGAF